MKSAFDIFDCIKEVTHFIIFEVVTISIVVYYEYKWIKTIIVELL